MFWWATMAVAHGWHIECSAMASSIIGSKMDIHTGRHWQLSHKTNSIDVCPPALEQTHDLRRAIQGVACAAKELPVTQVDGDYFGPLLDKTINELAKAGEWKLVPPL
ncbi:hypothetical protein BSKO_11497 [Bryopsis sp. KO-2023]|nr:hypothetical protein BSKO_02797 [Bryopsis sp. KO-2023]GMH43575.1 hypothetical protein BSKO_11497 [Bryopsis sp. KO-2023]